MRIEINPKYKSLLEQIEKVPLLFESKGEVVYEGRNVLKRTLINDIDVVVKSFKKPHIINRVVYSYFRKSKAERSFVYSMEIQQHGFGTPEPIAMIEQFQNGLLSHSYYICCYDSGETVRSLMDGKVEGNEDKLSAFARYTAALHQSGILHLDYSPGNILIHQNGVSEYSFSLVDVNRMQLLANIDCDTACRNMCRLCTSREVLAYIMAEYASLRGWDVKQTVDLSLYYTNQFFKRYVFRRAARKEASNHIISHILQFRISRSCRSLCSHSSRIYRYFWQKEKDIYDTYLQKYDYQNIFLKDYH